MNTIDPSVLEKLAGYDSATVQNAAILVRGHVPAGEDYSGPDLLEMAPGGKTVVGYAVTSTWMPLNGPAKSADHRDALWDAIADANGPVVVALKDVDSPARRGAIIGDGMAYTMRALGAVGAVVDGNARDAPGIREAGLGLWATGRAPGHGPFSLIEHDVPVDIAGLTVLPGDILVCDGDGVTRVPPAIAADVAEACAEVRAKEGKLHAYFSAADFSVEKWRAERG